MADGLESERENTGTRLMLGIWNLKGSGSRSVFSKGSSNDNGGNTWPTSSKYGPVSSPENFEGNLKRDRRHSSEVQLSFMKTSVLAKMEDIVFDFWKGCFCGVICEVAVSPRSSTKRGVFFISEYHVCQLLQLSVASLGELDVFFTYYFEHFSKLSYCASTGVPVCMRSENAKARENPTHLQHCTVYPKFFNKAIQQKGVM